jgi:predicted transcriptional regulator of viral defense system
VISSSIGLSKRERALLAEWERARKRSITLADVAHAVGDGPSRMVASTLVRKGVLDRLRPGLYAIRPFRAVARPWVVPALVAVELLLADAPHYVGGLAAFTLHRLTQQQHTSVVDVFVGRYRRPRQLGGAQILFHRRQEGAFRDGITRIEIDGVRVAVSDPERTLLDALEVFDVVGGMAEAIRLFRESVGRLDCARLVAYALQGAHDSTCQRLGLLLERAEIVGPFMADLRARAAQSTGQHLLLPGLDSSGPLHPEWRVVENDGAAKEPPR